jgi:hypothetical protein
LVIAVSFAWLIMMLSCNESEPIYGGHNHYDISESLQPLLFSPGSRWVYQCEETGEIDTVYLAQIDMDTLGPYAEENNYTASQQVYYLRFQSSLFGAFTEEYVGYVITLGTVRGGYIYLAGKSPGETTMNATVAAIHDSLTVKEQVYHHVVEMSIKTDAYIKRKMNLYFADSVGMIKQEIVKNHIINETWVLIASEVSF